MTKFIISFLLLSLSALFAQKSIVKGFITDSETGEPLSYASIRIDGTTYGTSSNLDGIFELKLEQGDYHLIFSFIGYRSDTLQISAPTKNQLIIELKPQAVKLAEVVVVAGENPAYRIIREAIKRKKENRKGLKNFDYNAYAKRIILSAGEVAVIEETFVKGYNKINVWEKEFIISSHKTENRKKEIHSMDFQISDRYYIDFSADTLSLLNNLVYLPIAENAFDNYDYQLIKTIETGNNEIYQIEVIPLSDIQPLLQGEITIDNITYSLNSINLETNEGVRFPYINNFSIKFVQQLGLYEKYWLPHYVQTYATLEVNIGGLLKIEPMSFNQISNITEYNINQPVPDSIEIAVRSKYGYFTPDTTGNEKKPSELKREEIISKRPIPLTTEEEIAYTELDSTQTMEKMIKVSGPLAALIPEPDEEPDTTTSFFQNVMNTFFNHVHYRNNRVDGIVLGARYDDRFITKNLNLNGAVGYSFPRKKAEGNILLNYKFNDFLINNLEIGVFNYAKLWQNFSPYPDILNSAAVTLGFEDQFNYYLSTGYKIAVRKRLGRSISVKLSFLSEKQEYLKESKYQSIFATKRFVRDNPEILEGRDNRASLFFLFGKNPLDVQVIPENGLIAQIDLSEPALNSDFKYQKFRLIGMVKTKTFYDELFVGPYLQFTIDAGIVTGDFGPQHTFSPNSRLAFYSPQGVFKGLKPYQFFGTEMLSLHFEHNWRTVPFQALGLDFITDLHIDLITGISALQMWNKSDYFIESTPDKPYWEVYVGLSRLFAFMRVDVSYNSLKRVSVTGAIAVMF